jgi:HAD superfamily hydrolase (TIGR01662 family)
MGQEVILVMGYPSSGKGSLASELEGVHLNRDAEGGKVIDLLPKMKASLKAGDSVVLDNTFPTVESRKPFIEAAKKAKVPIRCIFMGTSIEDSQINALHRMWDRYGKIFFAPADLKEVSDDPNMFPPAALFRYRKQLEKPTTNEGFANVRKEKFSRRPEPSRKGKALILDYDGTLRDVPPGSSQKYPIDPSEVNILPGRVEKLKEMEKDGYLLLGVSNQSGVAKRSLSHDDAVACFERTNDLLGFDIDYRFCPHQSAPPVCYCRKPQSGLAVALIREFDLDPSQCIFVGDYTTDKTFAKRIGFQYFDAKDFFKAVPARRG